MVKVLVFDEEHPNGYVCEVADEEVFEDVTEGIVDTKPTAEDRLAALESAVLEMIKGGANNG